MLLFNTTNEDTKYTANLGYYAYSHERYAEGFFYAANTLVENMHDKDEMIYPLFFLYRHMTELFLKQSIQLCQVTHGREVLTERELRNTHSLKTLWEGLEQIGAEYIRMQKTVDLVKSIVLEIDDYDQRSTRFRYADTEHESTTINIQLFGDLMNEVRHFFWMITEDCSHLLGEQGRIDELRKIGNDMRIFVNDFNIPVLDPTIKA